MTRIADDFSPAALARAVKSNLFDFFRYLGRAPQTDFREGEGVALTLAPLLEARQMGYRIGVLQSSELGFPVYRRMGFEQACQVEHFYWKAA